MAREDAEPTRLEAIKARSSDIPIDAGNCLSGYNRKGGHLQDRFHVHSLPKETVKKVFGIETSHIGYMQPPSSFRPNKLVSTERNQPTGVFAGPGGPREDLDRFRVNSIPKETMKKVFGIETGHIGYIQPSSTFKRTKMVSTEKNQPCGMFSGPGGPNPDLNRFYVNSIPKETMKKVFGIETSHIGYMDQPSSFKRTKMVSTEKNQPCGMFSGPGGPREDLDRFYVNSIPKETMKKVFGIETSQIGYIKPESSFRYHKVLSNEPRQPCSTFGDPQGPAPSYERMKYDSLPKEVMKKVFGVETKDVGFRMPKSSFRYDVGKPFGGDEKCKAPKDGNMITDDYFWTMRLKQEFRAQCDSNAKHGVLRGGGGRAAVPTGVHERSARYNAARKVCSTREGREFASTLSNLDRKLNSGVSRAPSRSGRRKKPNPKKQEAVKALKQLMDKMVEKGVSPKQGAQGSLS